MTDKTVREFTNRRAYWQYVPREPSKEMCEAGHTVTAKPDACWRAMLDAAPSATIIDDIDDLARSAYEEAMTFGLSFELIKKYFDAVAQKR